MQSCVRVTSYKSLYLSCEAKKGGKVLKLTVAIPVALHGPTGAPRAADEHGRAGARRAALLKPWATYHCP